MKLSHFMTVLIFPMSLNSVVGAENPVSLTLARTIPLPSVEGRIDHMAFDADGKRLYVAALGNNTVEVVDLVGGKRLSQITRLQEPQGIRVLPESGSVVVASGKDGKCRFYDKDQDLVATIDGLDDADNVRYDFEAKLIYVGYGNGSLAVMNPVKHTKIADISLQGHPESFQLEAKGNRIFVNVPSAGQIAVIDRQAHKTVATWSVTVASENFPMALDEANHRLFIGCRKPAKLLVFDTNSGKLVAGIDCCGDTDDIFYDAATRQIYVSGGEGVISVIAQQDRDQYIVLASLNTAAGARTSTFDPNTRQFYLAVPHRGDQKAEIRVYHVNGKENQ